MSEHEKISPPNGMDGATRQDDLAALQAECDRLQQRVRQLEAERDQYRAECYGWARRECERQGFPQEEQLKQLLEEEAGLPLSTFLPDLERAARGT
jgi:hypothetical protein